MPLNGTDFIFSEATGWPVLNFKMETYNISSLEVNITDRFLKDSPPGYCNISNYRIDKVLVNSTKQKVPLEKYSMLF